MKLLRAFRSGAIDLVQVQNHGNDRFIVGVDEG
jgi:hypothetical protein